MRTATSADYLEFIVESQLYGIAIEGVREITRVTEITPVPRAAAHLCGVTNLRGQVLPIIDLKVRLLGKVTERTRNTCIVVIETRRGDMGVLVDAVCRVVEMEKGDVISAPTSCHLPDTSLVKWIGNDGVSTVTILDLEECVTAVDYGKLRKDSEQRSAVMSAVMSPITAPATPAVATVGPISDWARRLIE